MPTSDTPDDGDRAGTVRAADRGSPSDTRYRFRHALLREALYEEVIALRRRVWHRTIGDALSVTAQPRSGCRRLSLSRKRRPACCRVVTSRQVSERSDTYAWLTAAARYEAALGLLQTDGGDAAVLGWLLLRIALLHRHADRTGRLRSWRERSSRRLTAADPLLAAYAQFNDGLFRCYAGEFGIGVG